MKKIACFAVIAALVAGVCQGHTWVCQWTPEGWTSCLGADFTKGRIEDTGTSGVVFSLETKAREKTEDYKRVLRAGWIGDVLGEKRTDGMVPYSGGTWHSLAYRHMELIAAEADDPPAREDPPMDRPVPSDEDRKISVAGDGVITIPAVACATREDGASPLLFMKSAVGGLQAHLSRCEADASKAVFEYEVEVPEAGKYHLTASVVTIHKGVSLQLTFSGSDTAIDLPMPYTAGMWQSSAAVELNLVKGKNTLAFAGKPKSPGVTIKEFKLVPQK